MLDDIYKRLDGVDTPYIKDVIDQMVKILDTFVIQDKKYGSSWKNDGLGPKSLFAESTAKHSRLKQLLWLPEPCDIDKEKTVETLRDRILYDLLTIVKIKLEWGFDECKVREEVDKT